MATLTGGTVKFTLSSIPGMASNSSRKHLL